MSDFENSGNLNYNDILLKAIMSSVNRDSSVLTLTAFLKNSGYSKKRIKSEIRKYKKQRKVFENKFSL